MTFQIETLLRHLREKTLTYSELYEIILWRIYEYDRVVNALLNVDIDANSAGYIFDDEFRSDKPLFGLPFSVKDTIMTTTITTTAGSPSVMEINTQAEIVTALRALGGFVISKTNCPEFSMDIQSFNDILPPTKNPYALDRTSGGSSGGSAVSVALGFDIFSVGTDLNGSLRIPASFCHVCSIKTTEGLLPIGGVIPPLRPTTKQRYNLTVGLMAKRVEYLQYITDHLFRYLEIKQEVGDISNPTIGITSDFPEILTQSEIIDAMNELFEYLGTKYNVERVSTSFDFKKLSRAQGIIANSYVHDDFEYLDHVNPDLVSTEEDLNWALEVKREVRGKIEAVLQDVDIWILPVAPVLPFPHNLSHAAIEINGEQVNYWKATLPYCTPFSIGGQPVITLPVKLIDGLPFGVQVVGRYNHDLDLLHIAQVLDNFLDNKQYPEILEKTFAEY